MPAMSPLSLANALGFSSSSLPSIDGLNGPEAPRVTLGAAPRTALSENLSFDGVLTDAIDAVESAQQKGDVEATKLAKGEGNIHETAIALEQADVSLRMLMKARNKVVDAYQEIMRMHV